MGALPDLSSAYSVLIGGVQQCGKAWLLQNPPELLQEMPLSDSSIPLPLGGAHAQRQVEGTLDVSLHYVIIGDVAPDGTPYGDPRVGLNANIDLFRSQVFRATPGSDHKLSVSVSAFGGSAKTGKLQTLEFTRGNTETSDGLTTSLCVMRVRLFGALT